MMNCCPEFVPALFLPRPHLGPLLVALEHERTQHHVERHGGVQRNPNSARDEHETADHLGKDFL